jgi:hypothetical protein
MIQMRAESFSKLDVCLLWEGQLDFATVSALFLPF